MIQRQEPAPSRVMGAGGAGGLTKGLALGGRSLASPSLFVLFSSKHTLLPSGEGTGLRVGAGLWASVDPRDRAPTWKSSSFPLGARGS